MTRHALNALALGIAATLATTATTRAGETIFGLTTDNNLVVFDSASPSVVRGGGPVTGLAANDTLVGIDYQPLSGKVILVGSLSNLYELSDTSGGSFAVTQLGATLDPALVGADFAFDFNPSLAGGQFARVISETDNNRVIDGFNGGYLGAVEKTPVFYNAGDANEGADPNIVGIAYDTNVPNAPSTQQYGIDATLRVLTTVANNAGTLETIGSLGLTSPITNEAGFDISGDTGAAFAALQSGAASDLYSIDLATGSASLVGAIGSGVIRDLTVIPVPEPTGLVLGGAVLAMVAAPRRKQQL